MSLIKCPECSGIVSDKAPVCPHCGCPATAFIIADNSNNSICCVRGKEYDLTKMRDLALHAELNTNRRDAWLSVMNTGMDFMDFIYLWSAIKALGYLPATYPLSEHEQRVMENIKQTDQKPTVNTPKCPTCGSTKIQKLDAFTRGAALGLFGVASKTARSQFVCGNCGYKW